MKKILSSFVILVLSTTVMTGYVYGQYNYIDSNFAKFLETKYPSCIVYHNPNQDTIPVDPGGYTIDTTCSIISKVDSLDIHGLGIQNLEGIEYFTSLTYLNCSGNQVYTSPPLPATLTYLDISLNQSFEGPFGYIPPLPNSLTYLDCSDYGPPLNGGILLALPALPPSLVYLKCSNVGLYNLPTLPNTLIYLDCSYQNNNTLTSSPRSLDSLPLLPPSLIYLNCSNNKISDLPALPNSLTHLDCSGMGWFDINYTFSPTLFCLPKLPDALTFLGIPNSVSCLPNFVNGLQIKEDTAGDPRDTGHLVFNFPICNNTNNINSCAIYSSDIILCPSIGNAAISSNITGTNYQWQLSTDSINFNSINNNTNYTGANADTLQLNNIPSSCYGYQFRCVVDGGTGNVYTLKFINAWTGAVDSAWEKGANWSCGTVPDNNTDVIINSGTIVLNSNTSVRSLTVSPNASLTINAPYNLTVTH
jgi:hypothetical protein